MKEYSILKSSREALLKKAGFGDRLDLFNTEAQNLIPKAPTSGTQGDTGNPHDQK